jgi:hypothetical protein
MAALITVNSGQIIYTGDTFNSPTCPIKICYGDDLNSVLKSLINTFCNNVNNGKVKISSSDSLADYLANKFTSTGNTITITTNTDVNGNQTLNLDTNLYSNILYNTQSGVTRTTIGDFQSYTLVGNTIDTNGDQLVVEADFSLASASNIGLSVYFDVLNINLVSSTASPVAGIKCTIYINRISNTSIQYYGTVEAYSSSTALIAINRIVPTTAVVNFSNANIIKTRMTAYTAGSVTCNYLTVKYLMA